MVRSMINMILSVGRNMKGMIKTSLYLMLLNKILETKNIYIYLNQQMTKYIL